MIFTCRIQHVQQMFHVTLYRMMCTIPDICKRSRTGHASDQPSMIRNETHFLIGEISAIIIDISARSMGEHDRPGRTFQNFAACYRTCMSHVDKNAKLIHQYDRFPANLSKPLRGIASKRAAAKLIIIIVRQRNYAQQSFPIEKGNPFDPSPRSGQSFKTYQPCPGSRKKRIGQFLRAGSQTIVSATLCISQLFNNADERFEMRRIGWLPCHAAIDNNRSSNPAPFHPCNMMQKARYIFLFIFCMACDVHENIGMNVKNRYHHPIKAFSAALSHRLQINDSA